MLPREKVAEVQYLLSLGNLSQRKISIMTGVSRVVVHRIATGKRKDRPERVKEPWEVDWGTKSERCPVCGARVKLPCMACIIRNASTATTISEVGIYPSGLELKAEHQARYEQVRQWRENQVDPTFSEVPKGWPFRKRFKKKVSA